MNEAKKVGHLKNCGYPDLDTGCTCCLEERKRIAELETQLQNIQQAAVKQCEEALGAKNERIAELERQFVNSDSLDWAICQGLHAAEILSCTPEHNPYEALHFGWAWVVGFDLARSANYQFARYAKKWNDRVAELKLQLTAANKRIAFLEEAHGMAPEMAMNLINDLQREREELRSKLETSNEAFGILEGVAEARAAANKTLRQENERLRGEAGDEKDWPDEPGKWERITVEKWEIHDRWGELGGMRYRRDQLPRGKWRKVK